jgi:hypothetical protein
VGCVLERTVRRIERHLRRSGVLDAAADAAGDEAEPEDMLPASAVSGEGPPAGPQWLRGLLPLVPACSVNPSSEAHSGLS